LIRQKQIEPHPIEEVALQGTVVADIQTSIASTIKLPSGYRIRYGGQFESEQRATTTLPLYSLLAMVVIAVLMFVAVQSLPATLAILINLPLALVGGLVAILLTGGVLSVASLIGFITLFAVVVRNGLPLVDNTNRRHAEGMELKEVIRAGSLQAPQCDPDDGSHLCPRHAAAGPGLRGRKRNPAAPGDRGARRSDHLHPAAQGHR